MQKSSQSSEFLVACCSNQREGGIRAEYPPCEIQPTMLLMIMMVVAWVHHITTHTYFYLSIFKFYTKTANLSLKIVLNRYKSEWYEWDRYFVFIYYYRLLLFSISFQTSSQNVCRCPFFDYLFPRVLSPLSSNLLQLYI